MPSGITCDCALCNIELQLLRDLSRTEPERFSELFTTSERLREYSSASSLLFRSQDFACGRRIR